MPDEFLYADLLGRPALYSCLRDVNVPDGLYRYYLGDSYGVDFPDRISETVCDDHWGTVLLREPLDLASIDMTEICFGFYEDDRGNPILHTAEDFTAGREPESLPLSLPLDEEDLCL